MYTLPEHKQVGTGTSVQGSRRQVKASPDVHNEGFVASHSVQWHRTHFQVATCGFQALRVLCMPPTQFQQRPIPGNVENQINPRAYCALKTTFTNPFSSIETS